MVIRCIKETNKFIASRNYSISVITVHPWRKDKEQLLGFFFFFLESHSVDLEEAIVKRLGKEVMFVLETVRKNFI
jgi:hypothetical protein